LKVDEFLEVQSSKKGPGTVGWWEDVIPTLTDEQRESLLQAAVEPRISHRTICIVMARWGHELSPAQVGHWRRNHVR
jgi:hypothetical protein